MTYIYKRSYAALALMALAVLALTGTAGPHVQEMRGVFDGFIQSEVSPPDPIRLQITEQEGRRFGGLLDVGGPHVIEGTVSAAGRVNYQSKSGGPHVIGQLDLLDFGEGGAIQVGTQKLAPKTDGSIIACVLVMRGFAGDGSVLPADYNGSIGEDGAISILISGRGDPERPSIQFGSVLLTINGEEHAFDLITSSSETGRFIAIGHNPAGAGHLIIDGSLTGPHVLEGKIILELEEGQDIDLDFEATSTGIVVVDGPAA
jgi:hypothetical protein